MNANANANADQNVRPDYDEVIKSIADYVLDTPIDSEEAWTTARYCLMDTLGCGLLALRFPECTKHLGPLVQGTLVPHGARVPGTSFELDPVKAAWDIGCIVRWLDYNDTWLAAEWGTLRITWAGSWPWRITFLAGEWPTVKHL